MEIILENPVHIKTYIWKKQDGCIITINENGRKYILNPEYSIVWEEIDDFKTLEEIAKVFSVRANISFDLAIDKVNIIAKELTNRDLISFENYLWLEDDYV